MTYSAIKKQSMPISFRKDTIILDLDHTLIHAVNSSQTLGQTLFNGNPTVEIWQTPNYHVYVRPHCQSFLNYCFGHYKKVILWSMGSRPYVERILQEMLQHYGVTFHEVYTRNEFPDSKNLSMIDVNTNRTLFLDDVPTRICNLSDQNIIEVPPFYSQNIDTDTYLLDLQKKLRCYAY